MNIYIFTVVEQLTDNYHSGGSLIVIARDLEHVRELTAPDESIRLSADELAAARIFPLAGDVEPQVFIFANEGCCD